MVDEAAFREARSASTPLPCVFAKALRASPDLPPDCTVKVVFAATDFEAEELLTQERAPKPGLEGDE